MDMPISAEDLQKAATLYSKGVAMSQSSEKKYTAKDMIEFGLSCVAAIPRENVEELGAATVTIALVAYDEAMEILGGHS